MEGIQPFDLVIVLSLLAMFVVGYAQGVVRRLLGIAAITFSLFLAAQARQPVGDYLAREWSTIASSYSHMVAFGAVFLAAAVTLSIGIQITYRPAPLFHRYPVLDEIVGGLLGVFEGILILIAIFLILDPHYTQQEVRQTVGVGEFRPLRVLFEFLDTSLTGVIFRDTIVPAFLAIFGLLIPADVRNAFASAGQALLAHR